MALHVERQNGLASYDNLGIVLFVVYLHYLSWLGIVDTNYIKSITKLYMFSHVILTRYNFSEFASKDLMYINWGEPE